jgi:hypothetical protein
MITSQGDSATKDDSPLGVPEEMQQEALRGTTEALVYGQTASKTRNQMRQTVETVASQQSPRNPGQHLKRGIVIPQPTYQQLGVNMQGTELSPGPGLLETFPKQGLAQEETMEDGQDRTSSPSRKML